MMGLEEAINALSQVKSQTEAGQNYLNLVADIFAPYNLTAIQEH